MRKVYFFWILIGVIIAVFLINQFFLPTKTVKKVQIPLLTKISPTTKPIEPAVLTKKTLFVPYWTLSEQKIATSGYDQVVYFGITANSNGVDPQEIGYKHIEQFFLETNSKSKRLLGVRMLNSDSNTAVLQNINIQQRIITQSMQIAKSKGFDGIVLDFEISALGFDKVTKNITEFESQFGDAIKANNLLFFTTIYGDTFARFRPFDVKNITAHTDGIMVMAYDFHKANGNSGPNFSLQDNQNEGYDFQTMTSDFLQQVPAKKMTVVFGLYGYDWPVDDKGNSISQATSLSDNQIKQKFLDSCQFQSCKVTKDQNSAETKITYKDSDNKNHIIWFEDMNSVAKKTSYLKSKGINSVAYWAYTYF